MRTLAHAFGVAKSTLASWFSRDDQVEQIRILRKLLDEKETACMFAKTFIEKPLYSVRAKYEHIRAWAHKFETSWMCRALSVSRSGYYSWLRATTGAPNEHKLRDMELTAKIEEIFESSRSCYGSPRIHAELVEQGERVSRKRVARLMREAGLRATSAPRFVKTTLSDHDERIAKDLVRRNFAVNAPDTIWVSDITYIWTGEGWGYLAVIIDLHARRVVGWAFDDNMRDTLLLEALNDALATRGKKSFAGLIFHSDRGSQYASNDFIQALEARAIRRSMSATGDCFDNSVAESFFATLKKELIYRSRYRTRAQARDSISEYIKTFYNPIRKHSHNEYLSPICKENLA